MKKVLWVLIITWVMFSSGCCLDVPYVPCIRAQKEGYHYALPQPASQPTVTTVSNIRY